MTGPLNDFRRLPNVAARVLGANVVTTNDEFYADVHQLIAPGPAAHDPHLYAPRGKVYDGWETRRRRDSLGAQGDHYAIVRLAAPSIVRGVDIDTAWFKGNYPPAASLLGTNLPGYPTAEELLDAKWEPLVDHAPLDGDASNVVEVDRPDRLFTHVRLVMHPDGGIARLRVYGEVVADPERLGGWVDLAAAENGGLIDGCSNWFYSWPSNVLGRGVATVMSDGWETARRRDDGNDWIVVRLGAPGVLHEAVIDTSRFVGNSPGWATLTDADSGTVLLPRTRLVPDTEQVFRLSAGEVARRVRLDIFPDGGISRLRLRGSVPESEQAAIVERWRALNPVSSDETGYFA